MPVCIDNTGLTPALISQVTHLRQVFEEKDIIILNRIF